MEVEQAAAEQEANVIANAMRTILTPEARDRLRVSNLVMQNLLLRSSSTCLHYIKTIRFKSHER